MLDSPTGSSETDHHWVRGTNRAVAGLLGRCQRGAFQPVPVGGEGAPAPLPALAIDDKVVRGARSERTGRSPCLLAAATHQDTR